MKYYITTHSLTKGILVVDTQPIDADQKRIQPEKWGDVYRIEDDAFTSLDDAKADAERRRFARVASLKKQLAKMEKLVVKVKE